MFFRLGSGREPVREWLKSLSPADRKTIGDDLKTLEIGWPPGMPLVEKIDRNLWETRNQLPHNRIARVLLTVSGTSVIPLHGFFKTTTKLTKRDLSLAKGRRDQYLRDEQ